MIADSDSAGPRRGDVKSFGKKKQKKIKNDFQNNNFETMSNEKKIKKMKIKKK